MPMCQSPKIADVLLRASILPANDNYLPEVTGRDSSKSKALAWPFGQRLLFCSVSACCYSFEIYRRWSRIKSYFAIEPEYAAVDREHL
jgi:hypothetical protein